MIKNIEIEGQSIAALRKTMRLSQEGLAHLCSCAPITIRRAEKGVATEKTLRSIAATFKTEWLVFLPRKPVDLEKFLDLSGTWQTFYIEQEPTFAPYVARERLAIDQSGNHITGMFSPTSTDHPQGYLGESLFEMKGNVLDPMVFGSYGRHETSDLYPQGTGVFHLKIIRNRSWAEGFCTFYSDDAVIASSLNIWVKENQKNTAQLLEVAERVIANEKRLMIAPKSIPQS
jgi:transcriptional regulator with XRE-family HTH domain